MPSALPTWWPDRATLAGELLRGVAVGGTLFVLGETPSFAVAVAALFVLLQLVTDGVEAIVGDYADHVLFGGLVLVGAGYVTTLSAPWWTPAAGALLGGWFLVDGVQHLRHGVTREEVGSPYVHDGGVLTGLLRALVARVAEPFRL
ncbi:hypothetical protein [Haloarcula pellucida]|uniref:Uncharacterized protein n=1 Tax=Haloarcula pellucida TaxID=1427151 RepID=A0A830GP93_9EURY|nr:hypothetical protein [Halomicroarcula pellucida]MBX0349154.1 hypothetical protein [Halomicroarcula pellucida]GGN99273.1 hypothetical protein GCM10009030_30610 [Halomicroarcula pellucida]